MGAIEINSAESCLSKKVMLQSHNLKRHEWVLDLWHNCNEVRKTESRLHTTDPHSGRELMARMDWIAQWRRRSRQANWFNQARLALGWGMFLVILSLVGAVYLSQASRIALIGRNTQILEESLDDLRQQNARVEQAIAEAQSLEAVYERAEELGLQFVRPDPATLDYIAIELPPTTPTVPQPSLVFIDDAPQTMGEALRLAIGNSVNRLIEGESRGE
jgi:hypothetical protein